MSISAKELYLQECKERGVRFAIIGPRNRSKDMQRRVEETAFQHFGKSCAELVQADHGFTYITTDEDYRGVAGIMLEFERMPDKELRDNK